jgi:hypothetical protein
MAAYRMAILYHLVITRVRSIRPPLRLSSRSPFTSYVVPTMPPKRAVSSGKRKADPEPDGEKSVGSEQTKKAKVAAPDSAEQTNPDLAPNGQPTNKVLPVKISFPPRADGATRIASWNICSLASSQKKVRSYKRRRARILEIKKTSRVSSTMWRLRTQIS